MSSQEGKPLKSAHICFDNAMSGAFIMSEKRINRIKRQHECGLIERKPERNPLRAEATPRQDWKIGYDSSIPYKEPEPSKWNYPDTDWGIMSKFSSQKKIYDEIYEKHANYAKEVEAFNQLKKDNERKIREEKKREMERASIKEKWKDIEDPDVVHITSYKNTMHDMDTLLDDPQNLGSGRKPKVRNTKADVKKLLSLHRDHGPIDTNKAIGTYKISAIKALEEKNPELLQEWRSERAANYVNKQTNPVTQPLPRGLPTEPFRPCGKKVAKPRQLAGLDSNGKKATRTHRVTHPAGGMDTHQLKSMLQDTEAQIERQKLAIGLNQPKRFG